MNQPSRKTSDVVMLFATGTIVTLAALGIFFVALEKGVQRKWILFWFLHSSAVLMVAWSLRAVIKRRQVLIPFCFWVPLHFAYASNLVANGFSFMSTVMLLLPETYCLVFVLAGLGRRSGDGTAK
jgi:hypothetical protein